MLPAVIPKPQPKVGRPELICPELANEICQLLLEGYTLRQLTSLSNMPSKSTLLRWAHGNEPHRQWFRDQYARAREGRAWMWADEILDIADDGSNDWIDREIGRDKEGDPVTIRVIDHEHVMRSKIRIDTRKFLMAKFLKGTFGKDADGGTGPGNPDDKTKLAPVAPQKVIVYRQKKPDQ